MAALRDRLLAPTWPEGHDYARRSIARLALGRFRTQPGAPTRAPRASQKPERASSLERRGDALPAEAAATVLRVLEQPVPRDVPVLEVAVGPSRRDHAALRGVEAHRAALDAREGDQLGVAGEVGDDLRCALRLVARRADVGAPMRAQRIL